MKEIDLFEQYETLPLRIQLIIGNWEDGNDCQEMLKEIEPFGYTFDYGLDMSPFNLQKISECEIGDWATFENWIVQDEGVSSNYGVVMSFSETEIPYCTETNWYAHMTLKNGESVTVNAHEIKKLY